MKSFAFLLLLTTTATASTLNVRLTDAPVSLDWNGLSTMIEAPLIANLNEGLFSYDSKGRWVPALAASVQKSKDRTEYTFHLRAGAKWSDGRSIVAGDFVNAWLRLLAPQSTSIYAYYLFDIEGAREFNQKETEDPKEVGIVAVDDATLKVTFKRPVNDWEANTAFWPLFPIRKDLIEKYGSNWTKPGVMVSSGAFRLETQEPGKRVTLKRNPYAPPVKSDIDQIDFHVIPSDEEAQGRLENGFFEFLSGKSAPARSKRSKIKNERARLLRTHLLGLNLAKFPMTNREFRLAVLKSISVSGLIPPNAPQLSELHQFIPPEVAGVKRTTAVATDLQAAREHLKKSGVVLDSKFKMRILTNQNEPFLTIGKNLQAQLSSRLGISVEIAAYASQDYTAYMNLGDYHATLITWTAKVPVPQDFLLPYGREASANRMNFQSPFYDTWISEGIQASSPSEARKSFEAAERLLGQEEAVALPLFLEKSVIQIRSSIKDVYFDPLGLPILKASHH